MNFTVVFPEFSGFSARVRGCGPSQVFLGSANGRTVGDGARHHDRVSFHPGPDRRTAQPRKCLRPGSVSVMPLDIVAVLLKTSSDLRGSVDRSGARGLEAALRESAGRVAPLQKLHRRIHYRGLQTAG